MGFFDEEEVNDRKSPFTNSMFGAQEEELQRILMDPSVDSKTRGLAKQVRNMENKVRRAGLDPSLTEPRSSFFGDLLDTLDAPRQGVAGVIDTTLRGDMFSEGVGTGWRRGQKENTTFSDILRREGGLENPWIREPLGFVMDVGTDPLSWLTLGTGTAAKIGGRALTKEGMELAKTVSGVMQTSGMTDIVQHSDAMDDVFKAAARYKDEYKNFQKSTSGNVKAISLDRMSKAESVFSPFIDTEKVINSDIFEPRKLRVGLNVPFLGHLAGAEEVGKEVLMKDPGIVGQALRLAGSAMKPGKVKIADIDLSDEMVDAFDNVRSFANEHISKIGQVLEATPIVSLGVKAAKGTMSALESANSAFKKIFNQKALVGADANNNRLDFINVRSANRIKAMEKVKEIFTPEELKDSGLMRDVYLEIDGMAMEAAKQTVSDNDVVSVFNRIKQTGDVLDGDRLLISETLKKGGTEDVFRVHLKNYLDNPNVPDNKKAIAQRVIGAMDELAVEEIDKGLGYQFLEYYLPHRYKNLGQMEGVTSPGKAESFTKKRTYASVGEAFEKQGLVADTELPELLRWRYQKGLDLLAQRQYAQRLMIEESLDPTLLQNLYRESITDPKGEAAKALARYRVKLKPVDPEMLIDGRTAQLYQEAVGKVASGDLEAGRIIADGSATLSQKVREEMFAAGGKPLDNWLPDGFLGELGEKVPMPGGGEMYLPKPIADSYRETVAARDILKDTLGTTAFGKATIKSLDHASSWFKKMVTLPWPAYWMQNFIGDRFNQAMQGIHAYNPGIFARAKSVLSGESAVISPTGMRLDRNALERVVKDMGLSYSINDMLGTVESFADMNIDAMIAGKNTLAQNVLSLEKGTKVAALRQVHDKFQRGFDGFFRLSHFVHKFERGDSVADAVRASQEAYFNYRDMSPVEQSLFRRFYMFYGYMSKATKQTLSSLVTAPGNLTMQLHGTRAMAGLMMDPTAAPTLEEHETKLLQSQVNMEQLSRTIGRTKDGKSITARGFAAPLNAVMQQLSVQTPRNFTVSELIDTFTDSSIRTFQKQFAMSNPIINSAAQAVSGKNLYFDKPLDTEFLRKLPDLTEAAKQISGYAHTDIPLTINETAKKWLGAVPDGKGRLIVSPTKMWILVNLIPGMGRAISTTGALTNEDLSWKQSGIRALTGINITEQDPSKTYLYDRKKELESFIGANSVNQRLKNLRDSQLGLDTDDD